MTEALSPDCMFNPYVLFMCDLLSGGQDCLHTGLYLIKRDIECISVGEELDCVGRALQTDRIPC